MLGVQVQPVGKPSSPLYRFMGEQGKDFGSHDLPVVEARKPLPLDLPCHTLNALISNETE